jgi:hypothetical protein
MFKIEQYYNQSTPIIFYLLNDIWIMQAWRIFGAKGFEDVLQCENMLDFNAFTCNGF